MVPRRVRCATVRIRSSLNRLPRSPRSPRTRNGCFLPPAHCHRYRTSALGRRWEYSSLIGPLHYNHLMTMHHVPEAGPYGPVRKLMPIFCTSGLFQRYPMRYNAGWPYGSPYVVPRLWPTIIMLSEQRIAMPRHAFALSPEKATWS